ncbi:hypothetical protein KIPB_003773 [Kipferlia bialata]|uniref:RRM domain-containing protein n=1 Tax=Kipferlia bialata TaxID=797122 RepID=A0A9K3GET1_9EUKA|nr:hypothetical protein KIPB_000803 [Kipferlia bialata]GIQ82608.1 hypothetical protein KIPB_003773 [Kipferlia bialata]|eukprot:g803.t1
MAKKQLLDITQAPSGGDQWDEEDDLEQFNTAPPAPARGSGSFQSSRGSSGYGSSSGGYGGSSGGYGSSSGGYGSSSGGYGSSSGGYGGSSGGYGGRSTSYNDYQETFEVPSRPPYGVLIRNLPYETTMEDIGMFLEQQYQINDMDKIVMHVNKDTGEARGWATVIIKTPESMQKLLDLNNTSFQGRPMLIKPERQDILERQCGQQQRGGFGQQRGGYGQTRAGAFAPPGGFSREGMGTGTSAAEKRAAHQAERRAYYESQRPEGSTSTFRSTNSFQAPARAEPAGPVDMSAKPRAAPAERKPKANPFGAAAPVETVDVWATPSSVQQRPARRERTAPEEKKKADRFGSARSMDWGRTNLSTEPKKAPKKEEAKEAPKPKAAPKAAPAKEAPAKSATKASHWGALKREE